MSRPAPARPGFSLQLEHGSGRLVLTDRSLGLLAVEVLALSLRDVPGRLDLRVGADRFRHQRTRLERLVVAVDEEALGQALAAATRGTPFQDVEVRITEGDVVIAGSVAGGRPTPFLCRIRPVPAGLAGERSILISAYETRVFGPCAFPAPVLAQQLMGLLGLGAWLRGPSLAALDPVDRLTLEVCASLGWKAPDRREARVEGLRCEGGRLSLAAARPVASAPGPRPLGAEPEAAWRERRFLEDYEACTLFAHLEARLAQGDLEGTVRGLRRQLEIHAGHAFLVGRLLQVQATRPEAAAEVRSLAGARLARFPDDVDALLALAAVRAREGAGHEAAELFERVGALARRRGDALEAAQAAWAAAAARAETQPRAAIAAYEEVLKTHHRLPGLLRALVDLHERVGDRAAALRIQQRLATAAAGPAERREHLLHLGRMALDGGDSALGRQAFEAVLTEHPDEVEALDGLAAAALQAGEHLAAVQSLDRAARLLRGRGDTEGAAQRTTRLGDLWAALPDGGPTAQLRYRQALLLAPQHAPALLGLAELARREGDRAGARARFEEVLRQGPDRGVDRFEVHLRLGRLLAEPPLDEPGLAAAHLQKALDGSPAHVEAALESLEALHRAAGRFDDVVRVLERAAARAVEPAVRSPRLLRLARVLIEHLGDRRRAVALLQEAARLDPENPMILDALVQVHREAGDHAALAEVLGRVAERTDDPDRLCALYLERAALLRLHLNRATEAAGAYALALGCRPASREALGGLADIYRAQDRPAELAEVLARQARLEVGREAGLLWLELARLQADVLGRTDAALASLEAAATTLTDDTEVLRRLGDVHFAAGRFEAALGPYRRLAAIYADEGYDEPAAPFLRRLAATQAAAGLAGEALASLELAAREAPDDVATSEQAQDLLLKSGDLNRISGFFLSQLQRARRPDARAFLARRAGRLLWRELRRPAEAGPLLDEALRLDPGDGDVQRIRLEVATAQGEWARVAELLQAQIAGAPVARRPALVVRLAQVLGGELGRRDEARRMLAEVLSERPGFEGALALLAAWESPAPAPEIAGPAPDAPTEAPGVEAPRGGEAPVGALEPAVTLEPDSDFSQPAPPPSERDTDALPPEVSSPVRPPVAERVVGGVEAAELAAGLQAREAAVNAAPDRASRAQARLLLAEYCRDAMHAPDEAMPLFEAAVQEAEPGSGPWVEALEALEDLYALRGAWDALLHIYDRRGEAGLLDAHDRRVLRAATLRSAGRPEEALAEVREALPDVRAQALEIELLLALGRKREAVERLLAEAANQSGEVAALGLDAAADLLHDLDPAGAIPLRQRARELAPTPERLAAWLDAARRLGSPAVLADALIAQAAEVTVGPRAAARQSRMLLEGAREVRGLPDGLLAARRLAELSCAAWPDNLDALVLLDEILVASGDQAALVAVIDRQLAAAMPGPWRDELVDRRARAIGGGDPPKTPSETETSVADEPAEVPARASGPVDVPEEAGELPQRLSLPPTDPDLAQQLRQGDRGELASALARRARQARGARRAELWARCGVALAGQPEEAETAFRAALEVPQAPLDVVLVAVQTLHRARPSGTAPDLLAHVERRLAGAKDAQTKAGLLALRGILKLERYRDVTGARADFHVAVGEAPGAALPAYGLAALDAEAGAFPSALAWLQVALHAGPANAVPLTADQEEAAFRLCGRVLAALGRATDLAGVARGILDAHPGCLPALAALDPVLTDQGAFGALADRIEAALASLPMPSVHWLWRQAELLAGPLRRRQDAVEAVQAVLTLEPTHAPARRLALALAGECEAWSEYVAHGEALLEQGGADLGSLRLAVARVYADLLAQPARSLAHLRALDAAGELPRDATSLYLHAARSAGDPEAIRAALQARVRLDGSPSARFALAEHLLQAGLRAEATAVLAPLDATALDVDSRQHLVLLREEAAEPSDG